MMKKLFQRNVKNDGDDHFINKMMMMMILVVAVVVVVMLMIILTLGSFSLKICTLSLKGNATSQD